MKIPDNLSEEEKKIYLEMLLQMQHPILPSKKEIPVVTYCTVTVQVICLHCGYPIVTNKVVHKDSIITYLDKHSKPVNVKVKKNCKITTYTSYCDGCESYLRTFSHEELVAKCFLLLKSNQLDTLERTRVFRRTETIEISTGVECNATPLLTPVSPGPTNILVRLGIVEPPLGMEAE